MSEKEFVLSSHLRISKKQQVPAISWQLGAFRSPGRLRRKRKSNKYVRFPIYLGLFVHVRGRIRSVTASPNSSKATSPRDFVVTWGFSLFGTFVWKAQKQQVCPFSYILGAFCPCQRKNSFSQHISVFLKSNKFPCLHGNLGLLPLYDAVTKRAKGSSLSIFLCTWGISPHVMTDKVVNKQTRD